MTTMNKRVVMARHPQGWVQEQDFRIEEAPIPMPKDGEFLVRIAYLSLDPYMRGVMDPGRSYLAKIGPGDVMIGGAVGEVIESENKRFQKGSFVTGNFGWQSHAISNGQGVMQVQPGKIPLSAYLGVLGMPGVTAHYGLLKIGEPKEGETVVVSAAAGAVGATVGQIAKIKGCRVVGIAGGREKCDLVKREFGFDECIDYKDPNWHDHFREATPKRVDVYFENVGGDVLETVAARLNAFARVPLCGIISQYNLDKPEGFTGMRHFLVNRAMVRGFIISDHLDHWPIALGELAGWVASGRIKFRETVADGLDNAPKAFIGMLKGANIGKQVVKVS